MKKEKARGKGKGPLRSMKPLVLVMLLVSGTIIPTRSSAQFVIADVIKLVLKKVINGIDIAVQKVQNKTIVLQNAEKELENTMAKLQLDGISDWVEKQRQLYADYYQELMQVKAVIAGYDRARDIISLQAKIVSEYQAASRLFRSDKHFTPEELDHIEQVYAGILNQSLQNLNQVLAVTTALTLEMDDAARMKLIDETDHRMQDNYNDLNRFNQQSIRLSLNRSTDDNDRETVKRLYGLP